MFPNVNEKLREKALSYLRNSTNLSNDYWERIRKLYLTPIVNEMGKERYITITDALIGIAPDYQENDGLLKKGTSQHITEFAKKLCDNVGINALIVKGVSTGRMMHYWLDVCIDGTELFYDITFALYIRDNFCGIGNRYKPDEWLALTPKQLYKNQPTRIIAYPQGYNLEYLGLNNLPLNMKEFFDTGA